MKQCRCTLAQRLVGDGCSVCNPKLAVEMSDTKRPATADVLRALRRADEWGTLLSRELAAVIRMLATTIVNGPSADDWETQQTSDAEMDAYLSGLELAEAIVQEES